MIPTTMNKLLNVSDDELMLKELKEKCANIKSDIENKKCLKEHLMLLVIENKSTSESLLQAKQDYKNQESDLLRTLFFIQVNADKQKILSRRKLNEFIVKHNSIQEKYKKLPLLTELEELSMFNMVIQDDIRKITDLFETTKKEYDELFEKLFNNFTQKVCEFSDIILKLKAKC